jgi:hypothetical protein
MTARACSTSAARNASLVDASPWMAASPCSSARSTASARGSITTIRPRSIPLPTSTSTAVWPLVPKPQMITWSFKRRLQNRSLIAWRDRSASSSTVVPTSSMRNRIRAGVTRSVVARRAPSLTGTTSPYPVVVVLTVA